MLSGKPLGEAIEQARKAKGISKSDLATLMGVKPPSVSGWINTGRIDKANLLKLIAFSADVVPISHWQLDPEMAFMLNGLVSAPAGDLSKELNSLPPKVNQAIQKLITLNSLNSSRAIKVSEAILTLLTQED